MVNAALPLAKRYDVFLSHQSGDKPWVEELARRLETAGLRPFLDKWHLVPGDPWQEALERALEESAACAVFLGATGLGPWENEEMRSALDAAVLHPAFRVIPVLLPGTERPEPGVLPAFLSRRTWVDFRRSFDDEDAFHRLVCGIRGVPPGHGTVAARPGVCPYRGLAAFEEEDAPFFFGREALTQWLVERLRRSRFLAVLGPSGSGKSSAVRAGLVPALRHGELPGSAAWPILVMKPGPRPLEELAVRLAPLLEADPDGGRVATVLQLQQSLAAGDLALHTALRLAFAGQGPDHRAVIVVDQLEEVFTLCSSEEARRRFLGNLIEAAGIAEGRAIVVVTMRADFYARAAVDPRLADRLSSDQVLVTPMTPEELRLAIESPAAKVGLEIDDGLVETILDDLGGQPGALPLLEHALLELWKRGDGTRLTHRVYGEIGGVHGAIARRAEEELGALSAGQQEIARRVLLRLVQPGEGTEDTRRRAHRSELIPASGQAGGIQAVIDRLAAARLLTIDRDSGTGEELVDVAHEALIRGWPRLRAWIEEGRSSLRTHRRLTERAEEWERLKRDDGSLLRGALLSEVEEWSQAHSGDMSPLDRDFVAASLALVVRAARQQRRATAILAGTALAAIVLALFFFLARRNVERQSRLNLAQQLAAQSSAAVERRPRLGILLAIESFEMQRQLGLKHFSGEEPFRKALWAAPGFESASGDELSADPGGQILVSADRRWLAIPTPDGLAVRDLSRADLARHVIPVPGGSTVLALTNEGQVALQSAAGARLAGPGATGDLARVTLDRAPSITQVDTDGRHFLLWDKGAFRLVDLAKPREAPVQLGQVEVAPVNLFGQEIYGVPFSSFSPDGRKLAVAVAKDVVQIYSLESLEPSGQAPVRVPCTGPGWMGFSSDGGRLAIRCQEEIHVWDLSAPGANSVVLANSKAILTTPTALSSDGRWLAHADGQGGVRLWNTGVPGDSRYVRDPKQVRNLHFSPDGHQLAGLSQDGAPWIWDLTDRKATPRLLRGHDQNVEDFAFSLDSSKLITASRGREVVWSLRSGLVEPASWQWSLENQFAQLISFQADSRLGVFGAQKLTTYRFFQGTHEPAGPRKDGWSWISSDYRWLVRAEGEALRFLDVRHPEAPALEWRIGNIVFPDFLPVSLSADGNVLVTSSLLWDRQRASPVQLQAPESQISWVAVSPDGQSLAGRDASGDVLFWDKIRDRDAAGGGPRLVRQKASSVRGQLSKTVFSPRGTYVAVNGRDEIRVFSPGALSDPPLILTGFRGSIHAIAFDPEERLLAAGGDEGKVFVWDLTAAGSLPDILNGPRDRLRVLDFSPDGNSLAALDGSNQITLWTMRVNDLIQQGCRVAGRNLTREEWRHYIGGQIDYRRTCQDFPEPSR